MLSTGSGNRLSIGSSKATQVTSGKVGSIIKTGASQSHASGVYQVFTSMWARFIPANNLFTYTCDMQVFPAVFPNATRISWNILTRDPDWGGVEGYLFVSYGNYDDSAGTITPRQTKNITTLTLDVDWTFTGAAASGLLSECWLTSASHATGANSAGNTPDTVCEVGFLPKCSPGSQSFAASLPSVGSFTDRFGETWNVGQSVSGDGVAPYFVAARSGYVDHHGPLDFKAYFALLQTAGKITGNEWFNGAAFGVEPYSGAGSLTVDKFTPTYA